jgi:hypothetical protein
MIASEFRSQARPPKTIMRLPGRNWRQRPLSFTISLDSRNRLLGHLSEKATSRPSDSPPTELTPRQVSKHMRVCRY